MRGSGWLHVVRGGDSRPSPFYRQRGGSLGAAEGEAASGQRPPRNLVKGALFVRGAPELDDGPLIEPDFIVPCEVWGHDLHDARIRAETLRLEGCRSLGAELLGPTVYGWRIGDPQHGWIPRRY